MKPGNTIGQLKLVKTEAPSLIIIPKLTSGGDIPSPIKLKKASKSII